MILLVGSLYSCYFLYNKYKHLLEVYDLSRILILYSIHRVVDGIYKEVNSVSIWNNYDSSRDVWKTSKWLPQRTFRFTTTGSEGQFTEIHLNFFISRTGEVRASKNRSDSKSTMKVLPDELVLHCFRPDVVKTVNQKPSCNFRVEDFDRQKVSAGSAGSSQDR